MQSQERCLVFEIYNYYEKITFLYQIAISVKLRYFIDILGRIIEDYLGGLIHQKWWEFATYINLRTTAIYLQGVDPSLNVLRGSKSIVGSSRPLRLHSEVIAAQQQQRPPR